MNIHNKSTLLHLMSLGSRYRYSAPYGVSRPQRGNCAIYNIRPKLILNSNLAKSHLLITPVSIVLSFEIVHKAQQCTCRAMFQFKMIGWLKYVMDKRDSTSCVLEMSFGRISYIAQSSSLLGWSWSLNTNDHGTMIINATFVMVFSYFRLETRALIQYKDVILPV